MIPVLFVRPSVLPQIDIYLGFSAVGAILWQRHRARAAAVSSRPHVAEATLAATGGLHNLTLRDLGGEGVLLRPEIRRDDVRLGQLRRSEREGGKDRGRGCGEVRSAYKS